MDAVNNALTPLRPTLQTVTQNLPNPLNDAAISLLGQQCYRSLVLQLDLSSSNSECTSLAISKALGIGIVGASAVVKIPQLLKLLQTRSAEGVSFLSYLLETASFVITLAYNVRHGFPFSTFGETAFIAVQDVAIAVLILAFTGRATTAAVFVASLAAAGYALFGEGNLVNMEMLGYFQAGAGVLGVASKLPQIYQIWSEGGTGQLSAFAVFNYLGGSLSRIFTTLKEVDDKLILYGFIAGFTLNAVLAAQTIYYWNDKKPSLPKKSSKRDGAATPNDASSASTSATPAGNTRSKGPSTRRRG
ncbi:MAG: hypothetical protein Q9159_004371 [Coniocarpon cinnabarinum]